MSLGKRMLEARLRLGKTQRQVSERSGLAVSYISRMENGRIVPSLRTLEKVSKALSVPINSFFDSEPILDSGDQCPVSLSGRCILDQLYVGRGRKAKMAVESYSREQLEILRLCNFLLHTGDDAILTTLGTLMKSLARAARR